MPFVETRSLSFSIALHAALLLIAAFGLPLLLPKAPDPEPLVMTVEILPMGEITNIKPSDKPIQEEQHAPTPKTPKPVTPSATEKPQEKAAPPKPAEKTKAAPEEKPFDPMEGEEPVPEQKPKEAEKPKDQPKPSPKADDFAALLNKLKQENKTAPDKKAADKTNTEANKTKSDAPYDASLPLSLSEKDTIRSQFVPCWKMPIGAKDPHSLSARIKLQLQADGTVISAALAPDQQSRYTNDTFFRAAADSALRAVQRCSPLKNLPSDKYGSWREMELTFDPSELM